jgi:hypothetical protein
MSTVLHRQDDAPDEPLVVFGNAKADNFFIKIPESLAARDTLSLGAKVLYGYLRHLALFRQHRQWCEPPTEEIAKAICVSVNQVTKHMRELSNEPCDAGNPDGQKLVVVKRRGQGKPNLYTVYDVLLSIPDFGEQEPVKAGIPTRGRSLLGQKEEPEGETNVSLEGDVPKLTKIEGRNLPLDTLAHECGVDPGGGNAGALATALNGAKRAADRRGIRALYWRELVMWAEAATRVEALAEANGDRFERALAAKIVERAAMYRRKMPDAMLTPTALRRWWSELEGMPERTATGHVKLYGLGEDDGFSWGDGTDG